MAIEQDETKYTVEFSWVNDPNTTCEGYNIKFHYIDKREMVTISLHDDGITLPALLLSETVDFLRKKSLIPGGGGTFPSFPPNVRSASKLELPVVAGAKDITDNIPSVPPKKASSPIESFSDSDNTNDIDGQISFDNPNIDVAATDAIDETSTDADNQDSQEGQKSLLSRARERQKFLRTGQRNKANKPGLKRLEKEGD